MKRHKIKREKAEPSTSQFRQKEEHDLAYYIHDRVELINQVFSVIKPKDLKAMAPECVRDISLNDLQELCLEELLGISSKRLCAVLDGCEPPSDTESSSRSPTPEMETISLDSISSDEEILSLSNSKKGKKHKHHRDSKSKGKKPKKSKEKDKNELQENNEADADMSKASRAGLTVLELLELQARARAIRAQLQNEQANKASEPVVAESSHHSTDNEVEIKEEPAEVVEISSDDDKDEKPDLKELQKDKPEETVTSGEKEGRKASRKKATTSPIQYKDSEALKTSEELDRTTKRVTIEENTQTVTKRVNDLIITVPQSKQSRKIKLNRNNVTVSVSNAPESNNLTKENSVPKPVTVKSTVIVKKRPQSAVSKVKHKEKAKKKQKKKEQDKNAEKDEKDGSDHDEITLQLSDSEKMDLLEDLDRKNFDNVTSSSSEDSESSSETETETSNDTSKEIFDKEDEAITKLVDTILEKDSTSTKESRTDTQNSETSKNEVNKTIASLSTNQHCDSTENKSKNNDNCSRQNLEKQLEEVENPTNVIQNDSSEICASQTVVKTSSDSIDSTSQILSTKGKQKVRITIENSMCHQQENSIEISLIDDIPLVVQKEDNSNSKHESNKGLNDGKDSPKLNNEICIPEGINEVQSSTQATCIREQSEHSDVIVTDTFQAKQSNKELIDAQKSPESQVSEKLLLKNNECDSNQIKAVDANAKTLNETEKGMSEGELSDQESSEIEAMEVEPEIVCISDEETSKSSQKKKKKKDKKSKKEKKSKKSKSDFCNTADENFYREKNTNNITTIGSRPGEEKPNLNIDNVNVDEDDIYEILELSDDSSCYEVEGTVLSKEPTALEIEALSAKIDEIEREDIITNDQICELEKTNEQEEDISRIEELKNVSWKDRYLGSTKVKRVLTTSNILNALRRKNKELKKKLEDSKKKEELGKDNQPKQEGKLESCHEEGSIAHYETLLGSTKFVDPMPDPLEVEQNPEPEEKTEGQETFNKNSINDSNDDKTQDSNTTKEMKKDAKQLLKMYKKLLKYNDMNRQKNPNKQKDSNKKKKKKSKKNKDTI